MSKALGMGFQIAVFLFGLAVMVLVWSSLVYPIFEQAGRLLRGEL